MSRIAQREGGILIPDDSIELLSVGLEAGFTERELQGMLHINQAGRDWLVGKITTEEYIDKLQFWGIPDPMELLTDYCDYVNLIIDPTHPL